MMDKTKAVRTIIITFLIIFTFLFAISLSGTDVIGFWKALGAQILFAGISYLVYISGDYKQETIGINRKTIFGSIFWGIIFGIVYVLALKIFPGLAIAQPLVPASISSDFRWFIVVIVSPIMETIFFLGALLAVIRDIPFFNKHPFLAVVIDAVFFALFHTGAYIFGFYDLPSYSVGFEAFSSNFSVFFSAFIFGIVSGSLVIWKKFQSLLIAMVLHLIINLFSFVSKAITVVI